MQGYLPFIGSGPSEAEETRDDPEYVEWYLSHGQAYEQLNGRVRDHTVAACLNACDPNCQQASYATPPLSVVVWLC